MEIWSEDFKKYQNSKLLLKSSNKFNEKAIIEKFNKFNVKDRLIVLDYCKSHEDHLMKYQKVDIVLDTFPYTGVTTSFKALWMNVPVLTMKGFNANSLCGESINLNNMEYFIADNKKEYIEKLPENEKLDNYRDKLFNEILNSYLIQINLLTNFLNKLDYILINIKLSMELNKK